MLVFATVGASKEKGLFSFKEEEEKWERSQLFPFLQSALMKAHSFLEKNYLQQSLCRRAVLFEFRSSAFLVELVCCYHV